MKSLLTTFHLRAVLSNCQHFCFYRGTCSNTWIQFSLFKNFFNGSSRGALFFSLCFLLLCLYFSLAFGKCRIYCVFVQLRVDLIYLKTWKTKSFFFIMSWYVKLLKLECTFCLFSHDGTTLLLCHSACCHRWFMHKQQLHSDKSLIHSELTVRSVY